MQKIEEEELNDDTDNEDSISNIDENEEEIEYEQTYKSVREDAN